MSRHKRGRNLHGVLLLDKPVGLTSNAALQRVRRLLDARKGGHTGNLDPLATGLLPLLFGSATRLAQMLLDADKQYLATVRLGVTTSTGDAEGDVLETRPVLWDPAAMDDLLTRFTGTIEQLPPMFSALKHQGRPLYSWARDGVEIERQTRQVTIHELRLVATRAEEFDLFVHCTKGTYVRTLAEDLGAAIGCGAHLSALRRVGSGPFSVDQAITLEAFEALDDAGRVGSLLPADVLVAHYPRVDVDAELAEYLATGQPVWLPQLETAPWLRAYGPGSRFLGMCQIDDQGRLAPRRMLSG